MTAADATAARRTCTDRTGSVIPSSHWTVGAAYESGRDAWTLRVRDDRVQIDFTTHLETRGHVEQNCY